MTKPMWRVWPRHPKTRPWTAESFLLDELDTGQDALVLVGPEGDFTIDEVRLAQAHGFRSVSLGRSRLRTETAGLVAVHLMHIRHACV